MGDDLFHADRHGRTDMGGQTMLIIAFRYANAPKTRY
jgi:hypothetical protein